MEQVDIGHIKLLCDLEELLNEAQSNQFHDFQNTKYAAPKIALVNKLKDLINNTMEGKYDQ